MENTKKCKGFILIREYPNCNRKIGSFEKYTSGEFLSYPEVWKPVYESEFVETDKHLIEIKVTKKSPAN